MSRNGTAVLGTLLAGVTAALALFVPAALGASGAQNFSGMIVTSGRTGERVVLASPVIARGTFDGVGRIVEVASQPGDPDNVDRDDLVFAAGTLHLLSTTTDASFSVDQHSCRFEAVISQTGEITGGTGRFSGASGSSSATVVARGLLARTPDGCSFDQAPLSEVDTISSSGTLSL
jgi:hypothetical protein